MSALFYSLLRWTPEHRRLGSLGKSACPAITCSQPQKTHGTMLHISIMERYTPAYATRQDARLMACLNRRRTDHSDKYVAGPSDQGR